MKYSDSVEKSAEFLRHAVPLMSRQAAALHPVSYAVWYEYVAGRNSALRASIDDHTRDGALLDEQTTADLFRRHIAELDEALAQRVTVGFQKVMADVARSATQAGNDASEFGDALEKLTGGLEEGKTAVEGELDALLQHTRGMQGSMGHLQGRLEESRREIELLRQEVTRAREDALADGLTGLSNRKGFDRALMDCLMAPSQDEDHGPCLLIADIDLFKRVNDTYGHVFGDKVIRGVAQILEHNVKGKDTAARYGGEEFAILLPDTPLAGARKLAERIRSAVERCRIKRVDGNDLVANVTVSFGVTSYRRGESAHDFVTRADAALYESKKGGRNRVTAA